MKKDDYQQYSTKQIAEAISVVNRHAKAAPDPRHLYSIKQKAIQRLFSEKKAKKIGLHYSNHPKFSQQHSTLLIKVDDYYFHLPPKREDFKQLKHLGSLDDSYRNPKPQLNLKNAKTILYNYIGWKPKENKKSRSYSYNRPISSWVAGGKRKTWSYFDR
ncbi:YkyB family protein [Salinibacillus xinjiangensis]|uniref:YkyB-like protein n=1 Tax=Salinibacillus xinjiangensis TaxID=1229268 RepID=A0A6G1X3L4_9BACI|nr:YkyB family protein [Salinibacillus xinjiangensis]MRG85581.1 hypothetical protein [Salinibacillus xinjiangensis]